MITSLLLQFVLGHSLTVSPISLTYHNFQDPEVERFYTKTIGKRTTLHPGLHLKYEHEFFQAYGWYFLDSFSQQAGGLMVGPKIDLWWFSFGAAGGLYVREYRRVTPLKFPLHKKVGPVALAGMAGLTGAIKVPIGGSHAVEVGCISAWRITNCSIGLNWEF